MPYLVEGRSSKMLTNINDIRRLATRTSGGRRLAHAKKMSDQLGYSDNLSVAAHFALTGLSAVWLFGAGNSALDDDSLALVSIHPEPPMAEMRELVMTTLNDLGFGNAQPLGEHVLLRDRFYVGVRFAFEGVSAIWLVDADHLRFVDDTGKLLKTVSFDGSQEVVGKAA
jgi:hypothetical protein